MPEKVFDLNKPPLTIDQLKQVSESSKRDIGEWLAYLAIPIVPWTTFSLLPMEDVMDKTLGAVLISFLVLIPAVCRSIERSTFRDSLLEAEDEDLVYLAERISEAKELRSPAVDQYLAAVRNQGRELRFGEYLMLRDATYDFVAKCKRDTTLSDARAVLYGKQEES